MKLIKHAHACITVEHDRSRLVVDPGTFEAGAAGLLAQATGVLVTHDHFDHFDADAVRAALDSRADLTVHGPARVIEALADTAAATEGRLVRVDGGEVLDVAGIEVAVFGGDHAQIHSGIPVPHNVGYLIAGTVFHPGDSYAVPSFDVDTLLVPVSGPWVKLGEAIDFVVAVGPRRTVQIHDVMLSDVGRSSASMFLGEGGLAGVPMLTLADGESLEA
jgi:L-ascorbate metabolism protein UlaG (beta-lactamase superfamily)